MTAELAQKTKLRDQGIEMKKPDGHRKSWNDLIKYDEKEDEIKKIAARIKDDYRNKWIHPNLDELKVYLKERTGIVTSDHELNIGLASGKALEILELTGQFLKKLFGDSIGH